MNKEKNLTSTILLVDDTPDNIHVARSLLESEGFNTLVATNGEIALKRAELLPDLILLDIQMPGIDGFETCKRLKANAKTKNIPIIFLSAFTDTGNIVKGFELGAVDYITKPFKAEEVLARVNLHIKMKRLEKDLRESNASKNKFFSILAHDLRNPFVAILGLLEIVITDYKHHTEEERLEYLRDVSDSAHKTYNLLDNLLSWSRSQLGTLRRIPASLNVNYIVSETISTVGGNASLKSIEIKKNVDESLEIFADSSMMGIVLLNLLTNAVKFSHPHGAIEISASRQAQSLGEVEKVEIVVADSGVGMNEKTLKKLFDITQTFSTAGTAEETGSGLGLLLCKEFITKNNGDLRIESVEGKGSKFFVSLPVRSENETV